MDPSHEKFTLDLLRSFLWFRVAVLVIAAFTGYEIRGCNLESDARDSLCEGSADTELSTESPDAGNR